MDWVAFFEQTRNAAKAKNFVELAAMLKISDGAISHYRTGKRLPTAWIIANCLKLQGHASPEQEAAKILREEAHSAEERAFWKRLTTAAAAALLCVVMQPAPAKEINNLGGVEFRPMYIML